MLILKGAVGKSRIVQDVCVCSKDNFIFRIGEPWNMYFDVDFLDADEYNAHSCDEWIKLIKAINEERVAANVRYTYFIIYTNLPEDNLSELIQWIEENECDLQCMQVLLTCR
jgi:hypothetical protein